MRRSTLSQSAVSVAAVPSPLESARLRRIIAAYTINRLGTWIGLVALTVAVFDHTHSAIAVAGLLLAWQAVPAFVVPALVARVETSARRGELSRLYAFEAVATASLAVLLWHFWLPAVLVIAALDGTAALAASALLRAEVARAAREHIEAPAVGAAQSPESLETERHEAERSANAALNVAFSATFVLGPVLGGAVVAGAGAPAALFIDVGSFLICGAMLTDLCPRVEEGGEGSVRARLRAAWRHINDVPALRALLLIETAALIFFEFAGPIEIVYAKATLHAGDSGYGLLLTAWGAGVVVGSVVFARSVRRTLGVMLSAGTLAIGLAYIGFAVAPSLAVACCAAVLGGLGNGVQWASVVSAVQRLTPQRLHGRMMGALESLGAICPAIGLSLGGSLVALASARGAFLVAGVGAAAAAVGFVWLALGGIDYAASEESPMPAPAGVLRDGSLGGRPRESSPSMHLE
ncbi:MAG: transporter [Solirubrobacterales bacterium]|nr:transporter [Solirubrobacterales bacterium]